MWGRSTLEKIELWGRGTLKKASQNRKFCFFLDITSPQFSTKLWATTKSREIHKLWGRNTLKKASLYYSFGISKNKKKRRDSPTESGDQYAYFRILQKKRIVGT